MEKHFRVIRPQGIVIMGQAYKGNDVFTTANVATLIDLLISRGLIEQIEGHHEAKEVKPAQNKAILKAKKGGTK